MDLDRQNIERRDFPVTRRGYEPAAVDGHLRTLADRIEELQRALEHRSGTEGTLAAAAGAQVQSILEAAEATAVEIERLARDDAQRARDEAAGDALRTREQAVQQATRHVAGVSAATSTLLERVQSMDGEVEQLVQSVRTGAGRLAADLGSLEGSMGELYDASAGRAGGPTQDGGSALRPPAGPGAFSVAGQGAQGFAPSAHRSSAATPSSAMPSSALPSPATPSSAMPSAGTALGGQAEQAPAPPLPPPAPVHEQPVGALASDLDGARLVALNMALNGESRLSTERYLAENFQITDQRKLLDEVYAAIEG